MLQSIVTTELFIIGFENETKITLTNTRLSPPQKKVLISNLLNKITPPPKSNISHEKASDQLQQVIDKGQITTISVSSAARLYTPDKKTHSKRYELSQEIPEVRLALIGYSTPTFEKAVICIRNIITPQN